MGLQSFPEESRQSPGFFEDPRMYYLPLIYSISLLYFSFVKLFGSNEVVELDPRLKNSLYAQQEVFVLVASGQASVARGQYDSIYVKVS